jgi:hypothetical protein
VLALAFGFTWVDAHAATPFTIAAIDVTMPSSGVGLSQFSISGIPITGTLALSCVYEGKEPLMKVPVCPLTPPIAYQVTAGGALKGTITFYPYGVPVPASVPRGRGSSRAAVELAFVGALLVGFGLRRRMRRWLALTALMVGSWAFLVGIDACGGSSSGMTPGTYPYTISAVNQNSLTNSPIAEATTTINVTVP